MAHPAINAGVDLIAGLSISGVVATGAILQFVLPQGSGKVWTLWGLARHDWAAVHSVVSVVLIVVVGVHLAVHWRWIGEVLARRLGLQGHRPALFGGLIATCIAVVGAVIIAAALTRVVRPSAGCDEANLCPASADVAVAADVGGVFAARCVACHSSGNARGGVILEPVATIPPAVRDQIRQVLKSGTGPHHLEGNAAAVIQRWLDAP